MLQFNVDVLERAGCDRAFDKHALGVAPFLIDAPGIRGRTWRQPEKHALRNHADRCRVAVVRIGHGGTVSYNHVDRAADVHLLNA